MTENPFVQLQSEIEHELLVRKACNDYYTYVQYTNTGFIPSRMQDWLCKEVQKFITADTGNAYDILLVSIPPQNGKSIAITETLPSWFLGRNPTQSVIVAGYSGDFVKRFGRRNLDKLQTYGEEIFGVTLAESPCNTSEFELSNGRGRALFAGIIGGITGNPANLVIIDDPIKTKEEAFSETTREKIKGEFVYSVKSRLAANAKIIIIQTRWHEDDLYGFALASEKCVTRINLPCECEDEDDPLGRKIGDALMPEIGKDNKWLNQFKQSFMYEEGISAWNAMYQGRPSAKEGNLLKREWWRYYDAPPTGIPYKIISVDAAFKDGEKNDFVCLQVWGKVDDQYYLLDNIKKHLNFVDTLTAIRTLLALHDGIWYILIEDKANGTALINVLSNEVEGVVPVKPEGGKVVRAHAVSAAIEGGRVHLPSYAAYLDDFVDECAIFPNGAHDDQVDAMTQALNRMIYVDALTEPKTTRRYVRYTDDMLQDLSTASDSLARELLDRWGYPEQWKEDDGEQDDFGTEPQRQ